MQGSYVHPDVRAAVGTLGGLRPEFRPSTMFMSNSSPVDAIRPECDISYCAQMEPSTNARSNALALEHGISPPQ